MKLNISLPLTLIILISTVLTASPVLADKKVNRYSKIDIKRKSIKLNNALFNRKK